MLKGEAECIAEEDKGRGYKKKKSHIYREPTID